MGTAAFSLRAQTPSRTSIDTGDQGRDETPTEAEMRADSALNTHGWGHDMGNHVGRGGGNGPARMQGRSGWREGMRAPAGDEAGHRLITRAALTFRNFGSSQLRGAGGHENLQARPTHASMT